jgi:hypothetical protein
MRRTKICTNLTQNEIKKKYRLVQIGFLKSCYCRGLDWSALKGIYEHRTKNIHHKSILQI